MQNGAEHSRAVPKPRGYLNPSLVRSVAFWITSTCILIAVLASLLAIWRFTGTDVLWRTVATCIVVAGGTVAFAFVNSLFACPPE
jgi:membrane protein YdbS with pleckstrin-like domain